MKKTLRDYFPILRTREELLEIINGSSRLNEVFSQWDAEYQKEFLDFCSGARGVKMLYDSFAKEILNPETIPERLNELLSLVLGSEVTILQVLPNDNTRIAEESSLLLMDIVVKLSDGSIANVEIQKIGYSFPGERCACYSADLLLRQYKQVRSTKNRKTFSYRDIKNVYTIVFFEQSTGVFHEFPDEYLHYFRQKSNTGLELNLLQEYILIPLDIFRKSYENRSIDNRLEAWLTFLCSDDPEKIIELIEKYPDFKAVYEQVYEICQNVERVMEMFSKELRILDQNTVKYMIDEMQSEIDRQKEELKQKDLQMKAEREKTEERDNLLKKALKRIAELEASINKNE